MSDFYENSLDAYRNWIPNTERDLLSGFSHEVRTPLILAKGCFQFILEDVYRDNPQRQQEFLNLILRILQYLDGVMSCTHDHLGRLARNEKVVNSHTEPDATESFPVELNDRELLLIVCHDTYRPLYLAKACCQKLLTISDNADMDLQGRLLRVLGEELTDLEESIKFAVRPVVQQW